LPRTQKYYDENLLLNKTLPKQRVVVPLFWGHIMKYCGRKTMLLLRRCLQGKKQFLFGHIAQRMNGQFFVLFFQTGIVKIFYKPSLYKKN